MKKMVNIIGFPRSLPVIKINDTLSISYYDCVEDTEVLSKAAETIAARLKAAACGCVITTETKGVGIATLSAACAALPLIVLRKNATPILPKDAWIEVDGGGSITSGKRGGFYIRSDKAAALASYKNIWLVDDIYSTGETLKTVKAALQTQFDKPLSGAAFILQETAAPRCLDAAEGVPLYFCGRLPFPN